MGDQADDPLLEGLVAGREDAFAALYDRLGPALFRAALRLLGSRPDAEDAVQEVFVGLVRARRSLAGVTDLRAYLFAALRHVAARIASRRPAERPLPPEELVGETPSRSQGPAAETADRLDRALRALPPEQRELLALKVDGGLTFAEVAAVLGISANTAASRYRYALEKLRAALQEW
jgi:RNA polymerase sigma-70 factor (ECF subfamily)